MAASDMTIKNCYSKWWYVTLQKTVESNQHVLILSKFVSSSFLIIKLTELALLSFQLYCFLIWLFYKWRLFPLVFSMIKNTLKAFDNFENKLKHQSAWSNVFLICQSTYILKIYSICHILRQNNFFLTK